MSNTECNPTPKLSFVTNVNSERNLRLLKSKTTDIRKINITPGLKVKPRSTLAEITGRKGEH